MTANLKPKVIAILGPTSSGKTGLAVKLARELGGEIVSADSRQVYRGLDIGTGKDLIEYSTGGQPVPYHLIDVAEPDEVFDLASFKEQATAAIKDILSRGRLPIVVGGTGLYLQALVDNYQLSTVEPDLVWRQEQEKLSLADLQVQLNELDPENIIQINSSDYQNKRRLIRYLENLQGHAVFNKRGESDHDWLLIGLDWPREELKARIRQRLLQRLEEGLVAEVKTVQANGLPWERLESLGLEYRFVSRYVRGQLDYDSMVEQLNIANSQLAKRQMSWYRRWEKQGREIFWNKNYSEVLSKIKEFLNI